MSLYPYVLDDDSTIIRVDDNITEIAGQNFNQVRDAIFKIERELGIKPAGTKNNLTEYLAVAHNTDGSIKTSALEAVGLVTLPIDNSDVGTNAGIIESKLDLDYSTATLYALITNNTADIANVQNLYSLLNLKVTNHITGSATPSLRHVLSHIDVNAVPSDSRDTGFVWDGLKNTSGGIRPASHLGEALEQINDELVEHQLAVAPELVHNASAIRVDGSNFEEISGDIDNVQEALEALDSMEQSSMGFHNATMHTGGVPVDSRAYKIGLDGYGQDVVPTYQATAYLANSGTGPSDSTITGDNIITFKTPSTDAGKYLLDSQMVLVVPGDIARVNYGNGLEGIFIVESVRFVPGTQWTIRLNSNNLCGTEDAYVRIDKPLFDKDIWGIAAVGASNAYPTSSFSGYLSSVIVADPKSAVALGNGFDPNKIDESHYNLYLQLYPTGNPVDHVITLAAIDVSGNAGTTPGYYTLENVVQSANNSLRAAGMNARFIAFAHNGNFGIAMADAINGASFSIVIGERSGSSIVEGIYTNNIIDEITDPGADALGLGAGAANYASPAYSSADFADSVIALQPTKIIIPRQNRCLMVNGSKRQYLKSAPNTDGYVVADGYWTGTITGRIPVLGVTVKTEYTIQKDLSTAGLFPGKTITVQPLIEYSDIYYKDSDYGRFIIESVVYNTTCPEGNAYTVLTVINGVHSLGDPEGTSTGPGVGLDVAIHFDASSVGFAQNNVVDLLSIGSYHRLFEIYGKSDSTTFAHERLRIPVQTASGQLLGTQNWRVRGASPKLQGFADSYYGINKYVRFYILDYNATTGEFDGYVGKGGPSHTITEFGTIITGRKNVPVRFYDNTGNDYIELEFLETSTTPESPTSISYPAYVDIQIFPTLELDDEFTILATCEVNWQNPSTQIVERVIDRRKIGSISEKEFTQSARDYINAGTRHLNNNGVISGFEYSSGVGSDTVVLNGGIAVVNGEIVTANNGTVQIPAVTDNGLTDVDWGLCVDEAGNLVVIPITSTKRHFFATYNGMSYFIPSVTFQELVMDRRDLCLLHIVNVTIESVTINTVDDARIFIKQESVNIPFTWMDGSVSGGASFRSVAALRNWINNSGGMKNTVIVRGNFDISSQLSLTGFTQPVTLIGEGATFTITSSIGLQIGSNIILKNIAFVYNPAAQLYDTGDIINAGYSTSDLDRGAIFVESADTEISDIIIDSCTFTSSLDQRPPFIQISLSRDSLVESLSITNNIFSDTGLAIDNAAIVFRNTWNTAISSGHFAPTLSNICIENNTASQNQTLFFGSNAYIFKTDYPTSGELASFATQLCPLNVNVINNTLGAIGYSFQESKFAHISARNSRQVGIAKIDKNTCKYIVGPCSLRKIQFLYDTLSGTGLWTGYYIPQFITSYSSAKVSITNNSIANIWAYASVAYAADNRGYSSVLNNTLRPLAAGDGLLTKILPYMGSMFGTAINPSAVTVYANVYNNTDTLRPLAVLNVSDNDIETEVIDGSTRYYRVGITAVGSHIITSNRIGSFTYRGVEVLESTNNGELSIITSNIISVYNALSEESNYKFIHVDSSVNSIVKDNVFNRPTLGPSTNINIISDPMLGKGQMFCNTNQTVGAYIPCWAGNWALASLPSADESHLIALPDVTSSTDGATSGTDVINVMSNPTHAASVGSAYIYFNSTTPSARWLIPLSEILPVGAKLINVKLVVTAGTIDVSASIFVFSMLGTPTIEGSTGMAFTGGDEELPNENGFSLSNVWQSSPTNNIVVNIYTTSGPLAIESVVKYLHIQYRF